MFLPFKGKALARILMVMVAAARRKLTILNTSADFFIGFLLSNFTVYYM